VAEKAAVRFHPLAEQDVLAAYLWYEERNTLVAQDFVIELDAAMLLIAESPRRWPRFRGRCRRFVLGRFPFSIVYLLRRDCIEVVALAHHRRRPGYWGGRT
jgi:plasmid stabilization system protein ParE